MDEQLEIAQQLLLYPSGLTTADLTKILTIILAKK